MLDVSGVWLRFPTLEGRKPMVGQSWMMKSILDYGGCTLFILSATELNIARVYRHQVVAWVLRGLGSTFC